MSGRNLEGVSCVIMPDDMKIIFLNIWNGKIKDALTDFLVEHAPTTHVFCLQEAYNSFRPTLEGLLPGFKGVHAYKMIGTSAGDDDFPLSIYVRDGIKIVATNVLLERDPDTGLGLHVEILEKGKSIHICDVHGRAYPGEKLDTPERLTQSRTLVDFFGSLRGQKIIGGDFNILPDTESIKTFEKNGYVDLIKKFAIRTTRNRFAWELYPDSKQMYSDYVFTGLDVKVKSLVVPENEISDHLPLILEID